MPTLENRRTFVRLIREWKADIVMGHRPNDYHPDHRVSVQLVYDISYLLAVPLASPVKAMNLKESPVIMHSARGRSITNEPERLICVPIDSVFDKKFESMHEHTSQFYEWLAWEQGLLEKVPKSREGRLKFLKDWRGPGYEQLADWCRTKAKVRKKTFRYAEAVYPAWTGRQLNNELIERLFPFEKLVVGF